MASEWFLSEKGWTDARNWSQRVLLICGIAALASVLLALGAFWLTSRLLWKPLQKQYFSQYRSASVPPFPLIGSDRNSYTFLYLNDERNGAEYLATDADVVESHGIFRLRSSAKERGIGGLAWRTVIAPDSEAYWSMRTNIYGGRSVADMWFGPRIFGLISFVGLVAFGIWKDHRVVEHNRKWKTDPGQPEIISPEQFNKRHRGDGIGLTLSPYEDETQIGVPGKVHAPQTIFIPKEYEQQHFLIMGDTGSGKTILILELLEQIRARGEAAIIYDPFGQFAATFYDPSRGDLIVHPPDARSPAWDLRAELASPYDIKNLVKSTLPDPPPGTDPYWVQSAQDVLAELLKARPSASELVSWLASEDEIDKRVAGTIAGKRISSDAKGMRASVMGSLAAAGTAFAELAPEDDCEASWNTRDWTQLRRGFLFFTTNANTREAVLPLISIWLDFLIKRLNSQADPTGPVPPSVWLIIDELYTLKKLPALVEAMTLGRKPNLRAVLGAQGKGQLLDLYGPHMAGVIVSQPQTKILMQTKDNESAKWVSEAFDDVMRERTAESLTAGVQDQRDSVNYHEERRAEPLVPKAVITSLPNRRGYLRFLNSVVRGEFSIPVRKPSIPAFIPRPARETGDENAQSRRVTEISEGTRSSPERKREQGDRGSEKSNLRMWR